MWSSVVVGVGGSDSPGARHKHAVCTAYPYVYLLGGRQGNLPLKDFWIYDLATRTWRQECEDKGSRPPPLQQHSMVTSNGKIFVFGGELCMSNETPLWIYEIQKRLWRKWKRPIGDEGGGDKSRCSRRREGGVVAPPGRRGHVAVINDDQMLIYGGYQDLRGSTAEMWAFNIRDESWQQISYRGDQPAARHAHSAVTHDNHIWVYGGMTDLTERNDFWKYDFTTRIWSQIRNRPSPGLLHSHVAVKLHSSMIVFGGERQGEVLNDLWRYHFATGMWEKLMPSGIKPQPRSQCCAFVAPSHATKLFRLTSGYSSLGGTSSTSGSSSGSSSGYSSSRTVDGVSGVRGNYKNPMSYAGKSAFSGYQMQDPAHIHDPTRICGCRNCREESDGDSDDEDNIDPHRLRTLIQMNCLNSQTPQNLKLSISKFSQLNLSHIGKYYNYSMLSNDSSESIVDESLSSTCDSTVSRIVKSQSIHGIKDQKIEVEDRKGALSRDILSVPNFADIQDNVGFEAHPLGQQTNVKVISVLPAEMNNESLLEDETCDLFNEIKGKLALSGYENTFSTDTSISENLMSFSCTESSLNSVTNFNSGAINSFTNPNYVGFDPDKESGGLLSQDYWRKGALDLESLRHKEFAEILKTPPDSGIGLGVEMEKRTPLDISFAALENFVSLENVTSRYEKFEKSTYKNLEAIKNFPRGISHAPGGRTDPNKDKQESCPHTTSRVTFCTEPQTEESRSGSRPGRTGRFPSEKTPRMNPFLKKEPPLEPKGPDAMYVIGGKETGQMSVFKRPISIWKLDFPY